MENAQEFIERKKVELEQDQVRTMKDGAGNAYVWNREAWTLMMQSDYPEKVFLVDRFRRDGDVQYRFSFYSVKKGRWVWNRSCPLIPAADLQPLLDKARSEKTIE
jgi:hypothetical protein